jgi:gamma-glutamyltranspeptidase/glutathione hydrolase
VVSAHPLASQAGDTVMRQGGNAFDAAVAVHFALAVVYPSAGNLGGGGFALTRTHAGSVAALDFRETCPLGVDSSTYLDAEGRIVEGRSLDGHLASGVPGSVAGMVALHDSLGCLPWSRLLAPAIRLARQGFALTEREARKLNDALPDIRRLSSRSPKPLAEGALWRAGDSLRLPFLAQTLTRIQQRGRAGFYGGPTARWLLAEMERGGGQITQRDLSSYRVLWRRPVHKRYHQYQVYSMPPPSAGGIGLLQMLASVEPFPLARWGPRHPATVHAMIEAERWVYADRSRWIGDPAFFDVPRATLLDSAYIRQRMAHYDSTQATDSEALQPGPARRWAESEQTTHFSVIDSAGNAVAVTTTLNQPFGSRVWVDSAGFLLNNEMDDFYLKPGEPNRYGLRGGQANAVAPGKRMASSMCPTIVERDGQLALVLGSPGGSTIPTTVFQVALHTMAHDMPMQQAVAAPRFHHQWKPDLVLAENQWFGWELVWPLWRRGHLLVPRFSGMGAADCLRRRPDGTLEAGADPRGDDASAGH